METLIIKYNNNESSLIETLLYYDRRSLIINEVLVNFYKLKFDFSKIDHKEIAEILNLLKINFSVDGEISINESIENVINIFNSNKISIERIVNVHEIKNKKYLFIDSFFYGLNKYNQVFKVKNVNTIKKLQTIKNEKNGNNTLRS